MVLQRVKSTQKVTTLPNLNTEMWQPRFFGIWYWIELCLEHEKVFSLAASMNQSMCFCAAVVETTVYVVCVAFFLFLFLKMHLLHISSVVLRGACPGVVLILQSCVFCRLQPLSHLQSITLVFIRNSALAMPNALPLAETEYMHSSDAVATAKTRPGLSFLSHLPTASFSLEVSVAAILDLVSKVKYI